MNWDDENFSCPVCKTQDYVPPSGIESSPVMIIGTMPGEDEVEKGIPFVGATGGVLKSELRRLGLDLNMFRLANLWFHPEPKITKTAEDKVLPYRTGTAYILGYKMRGGFRKHLEDSPGAIQLGFSGKHGWSIAGKSIWHSLRKLA